MSAGERVHVRGTIENRLAPGRHVVKCWVHRNHSYGDVVFDSLHVFDFVVFGRDETVGVVSLARELKAEIADGESR